MKQITCIVVCVCLLFTGCSQTAGTVEDSGVERTDAFSFVELKGDTDDVQHAAFSPDGKKIVTRSKNDTFRIWDAESGKELYALSGRFSRFSPDGKNFVTQSGGGFMRNDGITRIWDAETGKELYVLEGLFAFDGGSFGGGLSGFSPDSKKIVITMDGASREESTTKILDAESGKELYALSGRFSRFSPDSKKIVIRNEDNTIQIWDAETGKMLCVLTGAFDSVSFLPDGKKIVTISGGGGTTGRLSRQSEGSTRLPTTRIWDAETGKELHELTGGFAGFSPDGKKIAIQWSNATRIWDAETGKELHELTGGFAEFSPDGKKIATTMADDYLEESTTKIWDSETGKALYELSGDFRAFSPVGKIVTYRWDGTHQIWDASSGKQYAFPGHCQGISPDAKRIIVAVSGAFLIGDPSALAQYRQEMFANALNLQTELRNRGLDNVRDFLQFGSAELRNKLAEAEKNLRSADAFDRTDTQAKLEAVKAEIEIAKTEFAQKTFYNEYTYSAPDNNVQVDGNKSSFAMVIPTEFPSATVEKILFPMPNVTGTLSTEQSGTMLTVSGSTNDIRELVRNSGNYRAKVWFTNLRHSDGAVSADVLKIEIVKVQ